MIGRILLLRRRLLRLVVMVAGASMLLGGPDLTSSALASDTFTLQNNSGYLLDAEFLGQQAPGCATGEFAQNMGGFINSGQSASITISWNPFSSCGDTDFDVWGSAYCSPINPAYYDATGQPCNTATEIGGSSWSFVPDDPAVGSASLTCGPNSAMAVYVQMSSSGLTCTATNTSTIPTVNFISSVAFADPKYALVTVELFARRRVAAHVEVTLTRQRGSAHINVGHEELLVGWPELIAVPLDRATRKLLARGKQLKMRAVVRRDDGGQGKGDSKVLIVREYHGDLP